MNSLSVVIITKDEEKNLGRCLESVKWADEIIVIDSHSTDRTVELARSMGARVFSIEWQGYGAAKREGVKQASHDWILSVDADEVVSESLRDEIKQLSADDSGYAGYYLPRKTRFLDKWIMHCGWYPDHVLRLFRKTRGDFDGAVVHEKVVINGQTGYLKNDLLHYSYPSLEEYFRKFNRYTNLGADEAFKKGMSAGWYDLVVKPYAAFFKHYVQRQGFRDGWEGFLVSVLSAMAVMVKYAKLREMRKNTKVMERIYE